MKYLCVVLGLMLVLAGLIAAGDRFEQSKAQLSEAGCVSFRFRHIIQSNVFDTVDTLDGEACIARDGRYDIRLGEERLLRDSSYRYSYSPSTNQIIIERLEDGDLSADEVSFITNLDRFYVTTAGDSKFCYLLTKRPDVRIDLPDSLTVLLDSVARIHELHYRDLNEDLNVIELIEQILTDDCSDDRIVPNFPDSAERVRL